VSITKRLLPLIIGVFIFTKTHAQGGWEKNLQGRWVYVMKSTPPQTYSPTKKTSTSSEPVKKTTETPIEYTPVKEKEIVFDETGPEQDGYRMVRLKEKWGLIDWNGHISIPPVYDYIMPSPAWLVAALKNEKWGFVAKGGNVIIDFQFDAVLETFENDRYPLVIKDGLKFRIKNTGEPVGKIINMKEEAAAKLLRSKYKYVLDFKNGFAIVLDSNDRYGFIDESKNEVVHPKYDFACDFKEGIALVRLNNKWGLVNRYGQEVVPPIYDKTGYSFTEGLIPLKLDSLWGYVDSTGTMVIPMKFEYGGSFDEGLATVGLNGKFGFIDYKGNMVVPAIYEESLYFWENIAMVKLNGKWGYMDRNGKIVAPIIYDEIKDITNGKGSGLLNGKWVDVKFK